MRRCAKSASPSAPSIIPAQLSGGQQQRVAIARALINRPQLILADEPTGALDSHSGVEIMSIFQRLNREAGITLVVVTHEPDIAAYANRILRFKDGRLVSDESVAEPSHARLELGALARTGRRGGGMNLLASVRIALKALRVNRLRSALTMLGIIIGVASVVAMVAVGSGATQRIEEQIQSIGSNVIIVLSGSITSNGLRLGSGASPTLERR